jgi:voltage-gated potassium channel
MFDKDILNLLLNIFVCFLFYFCVYAVLYTRNPANFSGAHSYIDILYFTISTQTSIGFGDITPTTDISKLVVSSHQIVIILLAIRFIAPLVKT